MEIVFSCEHITKSYENTPTITDVNLTVGQGQIVSLLGVSGVGKSTLMGVLAGVDAPDAGRVLLRGETITGKAGSVGYMLQKDLLLPYKRIIDNVSLPLVLRGAPKADARRQAAQHFGQFGLSGYEQKFPHQLSGGMRQRAALLRTYLAGRDIFLLDEPFSALDAITKAVMHKWYLGIIGEIGASTLFITHDIDEAITLSDKICILAGHPGRITKEFALPERPRPEGFATSREFMNLKRDLVSEIGI